MKIPLSRPDITQSDIDAVVGVLRTPELSLGSKLIEFEKTFADYTGSAQAVALSSGTAGLHLGLQALGIKPGDEVILPSFTFVAVANAVLYLQARPVFAEINPVTLNITPESIETVITARTRAVIVVHTFGYPVELNPVLRLARKHRLVVIEDACEAVGAEYDVRKVGSFGEIGVFSFYPNKPITTGEGGVLVTNDVAVAQTIRALRNQGRRENDGWMNHELLGYNYRLPEINCALGLTQLKRIDRILARREAIAFRYSNRLQACPDVTLPPMTCVNGRICWFAYVIRLTPRFSKADRDRIAGYLVARGIGCRAYFPPIHLQPLYSKYTNASNKLDITEQSSSQTLALPFFNALTDDQIDQVCSALEEAIALCKT